jgi:16S rRNA (guanine(966)-N(2))-methyltransferase RsmD
MRIVSGMARGIRLKAPPGRAVRPTSDRVKEALFAALGDVRGQRVADLFAGTGALGLEALSRGADFVLFVERDSRALSCIRSNLALVLPSFSANPAGATRILAADWRNVTRAAADCAGSLDLILADPPYRPGPGDVGAGDLLLDESFRSWAGSALMVLEHAADTSLPWAPASGWHLLKERRYGDRALSFCRAAIDQSPHST